ncbi:hypothetical protein SAMN05216266_12745 [Amycolatopsis marina]|uniref:DUF5667 domain-containing protein n=1 Tax=Amycolatopsis marina TaxID=490629 RepID=A0A1I1CER3_9PSEU|nr:hypothetical protein [Amycolatopsis marina]SFB61139.1 hypothetical protein SAMN05216266_12745 [Amycolatopsis marina]
MKSRFARSIAAIAVGGMLAVSMAGMASASVVDNGKGTSSTEAAGAQVLELRDHLARVAYAGDVRSTKDALQRLDPLLGDLSAGQVYAIQAEAQEIAGTAQAQRNENARVLADPGSAPRQVPQASALPSLPDPLTMLNGLLQSLLQTLSKLLINLLGPLPVPPVPAPQGQVSIH